MIHATTIISSSRAPAASRTMSKGEDSDTPGDRLNGGNLPAQSLNPLTTPAVAPNDAFLSVYQGIVISVVIHLTPPRSPVTAYPEDSPLHNSAVQPLDRPAAHYTRSLGANSTAVEGTNPLWGPSYTLNSSTAFPAGRSSLYPSSMSVSSYSSRRSPSTLTNHPSSTHPTMISLFVTESLVSTVVEVVSLIR